MNQIQHEQGSSFNHDEQPSKNISTALIILCAPLLWIYCREKQKVRKKEKQSKMSRTRAQKEDKAGPFFLATLVLWFVSVLFEILFHRRSQLLSIVAGCFFYQLANWVVRAFVSRDPLFVNTSVSLLHSTLTSSSGLFSFLAVLFSWEFFLGFFEYVSWSFSMHRI